MDNFIEPFAGSCAVLLARPTPPKVETLNDLDCYVCNVWRAIQAAPEAVAEHADWPVNEIDLHARHRYLVLGPEAPTFRERMRSDPLYFDARFAGWWLWGISCWIGGGWCSVPDEGGGNEAMYEKRPFLTMSMAWVFTSKARRDTRDGQLSFVPTAFMPKAIPLRLKVGRSWPTLTPVVGACMATTRP